MREAIQLVRGAVSTKDLVPVLTHFAIHQGKLHGYNGRVHLCAESTDLAELSLTVPAVPFLKAVDGAGERPFALRLLTAPSDLGAPGIGDLPLGAPTPQPRAPEPPITAQIRPGEGDTAPPWRLAIESPPFRAILPVGPVTAFPRIEDALTQGRVPLKGGFLPPLARLHPFIGDDASRPWACGIWACGAILAATNNVVAAVIGLGGGRLWPNPKGTILPVHAIDELLRIGREPSQLLVTDQELTCWLPGKAWLKTSLIEGQWPASPIEFIRGLAANAKWQRIPPDLKAAIEQIRPFCIDAKNPLVTLEGHCVRTQEGEMSAEVGGFGFPTKCTFRVEPLLTVLVEATHADWSKFPRVPWKGKDIEGAIVGVVQ